MQWLKKLRPARKGWTVTSPTPQLPAGKREVPEDVLKAVFREVMLDRMPHLVLLCGHDVSMILSSERTCIPRQCAHSISCHLQFARLELRKRMEGTWEEGSLPSLLGKGVTLNTLLLRVQGELLKELEELKGERMPLLPKG